MFADYAAGKPSRYLRDDDRLHELVAEEVRRLTGDKGQTRERLQRRLAELDQQIATVRGHLKRMDPQTANDMGLYDEAKGYAEERRDIERDLGLASATMPMIPDAAELRRRAIAGLQGLDEVVASGSIEERKELIAGYLHSVVADPDRQIVQINLYPTLFSQIMTGVGLEPGHNSRRKTHIAPAGGALSGALTELSTVGQGIDADLQRLIDRWAGLSDEVRRSVLALIDRQ